MSGLLYYYPDTHSLVDTFTRTREAGAQVRVCVVVDLDPLSGSPPSGPAFPALAYQELGSQCSNHDGLGAETAMKQCDYTTSYSLSENTTGSSPVISMN